MSVSKNKRNNYKILTTMNTLRISSLSQRDKGRTDKAQIKINKSLCAISPKQKKNYTIIFSI